MRFNSTRRFLLHTFLAGACFSRSRAFARKGDKQRVLRTYTITFPREMSEQEYTRSSTTWANQEQIRRTILDFEASGKLLSRSENFDRAGGRVTYQYLFSSKDSFWEWESLMEKLFSDPILHEKNFKIDSSYKLV
jgi:hypothetical protein